MAQDEADRRVLDHLRRHSGVSVGDLGDLLGVTATAVRQRLTRLMAEGLIERRREQRDADPPLDPAEGEAKRYGRGRPSYEYHLTESGRRAAGDNYNDLAEVLWQEVRAIDDPAVRVGLIKRVAEKLADRYADHVDGPDLAARMKSLMALMGDREVPVEVDESGGLPVLTMLACPYPKLAEQDRSVCSIEKAMLSEVLGQGVKLSECRLDGSDCCSFEPSTATAAD